MTAPALLEVCDLSYAYGDHVAVDGMSFTLRRGEALGLLGPNGAGKTTTFSCLAGLRRPRSGELRLEGRTFLPFACDTDRAVLGLVPQEVSLYADLTARENLAFFGRIQGVAPEELDDRIAAALTLAGLEDRADHRIATFSGGMKRRLNLAVATLHQPPILLLDEPTVGVDPHSRHHLFAALERLRDGGASLLYSTHAMEDAQRLCDRIVVLDHGRVLAVGTHEELAAGVGEPGADLETVFLHLTGRSLRDS